MSEPATLAARSLPRPTAAPAVPSGLSRLPGAAWVYAYIAIEIGCQLALLVEALAPARVVFRSAALGTSLLMLAIVPRHGAHRHPARDLALAAMVILTLSALNPLSSTPLAIAAHWGFHLAVLGPVFWVMRLELKGSTLVNLLLIVWALSTASSVVGMLQVYFPGQFQPAISTLIRADQVLAIRLSSGAWVPRPMGLTDIPGGAAWSGLYAAMFGLGVTLARPFRYARVAGIFSMLAGATCIYLCQVRAMIVTLSVCCVALFTLLTMTGRFSRVALALVVGAVIAFVGFYLAFAVAGDTVTTRLQSLVETDPTSFYHRNRGRMVEAAFTRILPEYPFGAGLGRWGMVNQYFGSGDGVWVEVQWAAWVVDGGFLLVLVYPAAVITAIVAAARAALKSMGEASGLWAAIVAAHGIGTLALTFSYPAFMSTNGVQFWLINAVLIRSLLSKESAQTAALPS